MHKCSLLLGLSLITIFTLGLMGCGGGTSGGGPSPGDYGDYQLDTVAKVVSYTQPTNIPKQITAVKAQFTCTTESSSLDGQDVLFHPDGSGGWVLSISSSSTAFPVAANGTFRMTVYALLAGGSSSVITIGQSREVQLDVKGGGGPPPPPF